MIYFINNFNSLKNNLAVHTINIAYKLLYFFSFCQIYLNKMNNYVSPKIKHINKYCDKYLKDKGWIVPVIIKKFIILDNDGNIKITVFIREEYEHSIIKNYNCSSLILCDKNEDNCINYVIYKNFTSSNFTSSNYKLSNVKFLSIELHYNNEIYPINLKDDKQNYYIVNNCFDDVFFKYYIKYILKLQVDEHTFCYNITIIDNNVKIINISQYQGIQINENDYEIYSCRK
jgi:hypothetical protein